jgi:hypothetical protein
MAALRNKLFTARTIRVFAAGAGVDPQVMTRYLEGRPVGGPDGIRCREHVKKLVKDARTRGYLAVDYALEAAIAAQDKLAAKASAKASKASKASKATT